MSKITNLSRVKVGVLASGAAVAAILVSAPVAGAAPAAPPAPTPAGGQVQGTAVDSPVPGQPNAILGHSKPDRVTTSYQNGEERKTVYWRWEIKAFHPLVLPQLGAPDEAPYVATNGETRYDSDLEYAFANSTTFVADMKAEASGGVGYGSLRGPTTVNDPKRPEDVRLMTGTSAGDLFHNNVWAGFDDGTFALTVTFTSDPAHAARHERDAGNHGYIWPGSALFPWGR